LLKLDLQYRTLLKPFRLIWCHVVKSCDVKPHDFSAAIMLTSCYTTGARLVSVATDVAVRKG